MLKDDFLHYIGSERNYSERTLKTYNQSLTLFQRHMEAQGRPIDWTAVEEGDIREWMVAMMNNGSAPTTVNNRLSALRSFYRFLIGRDLTRHDPTQRIEGPKKQKPLPHFIKESEMDRLLDHTAFPDTYEGHRDHAILQLFYTTGMRLAELVGLDTGDIDFGNHTVKVTGKRNKQRIIPLVPETETELREYLRVRHQMFHDVPHDDALFIGSRARRIKRYHVEDIVKNYLGSVTTQQKRSPHVLRHSFATAMLNHGAEISVVKELLGHESISTTEIYTHTTFEELKRIYRQAHPHSDAPADE
ncbi:MAG: tyrosine-type recombinase/integrase [Bacteroidaceae bacterium]|nr:tyrosine-type recombinase/integrase [Bacteroidaceae bacterium]MBQ2029583.1 tyrosine-type recombinase/integrase [Bacteroidaceae bacterium]